MEIEHVNQLEDDNQLEHANQFAQLINACRENNIQLVKELINSDVDINNVYRLTYRPLVYACHYNRLEIVELLLDNGAIIDCCIDNKTSLNKKSIFMYACRFSKKEIIQLLMQRKADPNYVTELGSTALICYMNNPEIDTSTLEELIFISKKVILEKFKNKTAFDVYNEKGYTFLDEYYLRLLKGDSVLSSTKSAIVH